MPTVQSLNEAAAILTGRLVSAPNAPFGVVGSLDLGGSPIRRHPDVDHMLFGYRGQAVPEDHVWITPAEACDAALNTSYADLPPERQTVVDLAHGAAVEWIVAHTDANAFGVA